MIDAGQDMGWNPATRSSIFVMPKYMPAASRLEELRLARGITRNQLVEISGMDQSAVSRLIHAHTPMTIKLAERFGKILRCDPLLLLEPMGSPIPFLMSVQPKFGFGPDYKPRLSAVAEALFTDYESLLAFIKTGELDGMTENTQARLHDARARLIRAGTWPADADPLIEEDDEEPHSEAA